MNDRAVARRRRAVLAGGLELGGAVLGVAIGGIVGLVVGIHVSWLTSPFAVVEGATFGLVIGAAVGCVPALFVLLSALAVRR
jgi:hypothetical protein